MIRKTLPLLPLAALGLAEAQAATHTYQYYRFNIIKMRNHTAELQMSEFRLREGTTDKTSAATVTAPGATGGQNTGEGVANIRDGNINNKWFSGTKVPVIFAFTAPTAIDNYSYATGNDFDSRDPVSWTLEGSNTGTAGPWTKIDEIIDANITFDRNVWIPDRIIPAEVAPEFSFFQIRPSVVRNGKLVSMDWQVSRATSFVLNPGNQTIEEGYVDLVPPPEADTLYTLTASNTAGSRNASRTVRSVTGGDAAYRYIRFSPLAVRGGTTIQLADLRLYHAVTDGGGEVVRTERVPLLARTGTTGSWTESAAEGPNKLRDQNPATKWLSFTATTDVTFDMGAGTPLPFNEYDLVTGNDEPNRTPIRWRLDGSNDLTTWSRIDDLSTFDVYMPQTPGTAEVFPVPGPSLPPLATFSANTVKVAAGDPATFSWSVADAAEITITPDIGTVAASGPLTFIPVTGGTYTLRAKSPAGFTVTRTLDLGVVTLANALPSYPDFDNENGELALAGSSAILADANTPNPGPARRLRLTPDLAGRNGGAWFTRRIAVGGGFDTTFSFMMTKAGNPPGADGFSFMIQNSASGNSLTGPGEAGFANALNVGLDTYQNAGEPSAALLKVFTSAGATPLVNVNLAAVAGITTLNMPGTSTNTGTVATLVHPRASAQPHTVRITLADKKLNVWFDGVKVVTDTAVDLAALGAVDTEGKAYVGFSARTGGLSAAHDITSWTLTLPGTVTPLPLAVTSHTLNATTGAGSITWSSTPGKTYRITSSADLGSFPATLLDNIASDGTSTTRTFSFTPGTRGFFRVEEKP